MIGDAGQDVTQVGFRVEAVELGRFGERVDGGGTLATRVRSGEEIILAAKGDAADRTLGGIIVDLDAAIVDVAGLGIPTIQRIAHGGGKIGFAREFRQGGFELRLVIVEQRQRLLFATSLPLIGWFAPDIGLNAIQCPDAVEGLAGDGRAIGGVHIEELAPHMGPAGGFGNFPRLEDGIEAGIAVRVKDTLEALQMKLRMFAFPV